VKQNKIKSFDSGRNCSPKEAANETGVWSIVQNSVKYKRRAQPLKLRESLSAISICTDLPPSRSQYCRSAPLSCEAPAATAAAFDGASVGRSAIYRVPDDARHDAKLAERATSD